MFNQENPKLAVIFGDAARTTENHYLNTTTLT